MITKDELIWYEKYRPKKISDMVLKLKQARIFAEWIKKAEIPHLLFYGPAGSGKTTLARILIDGCAGRSLILNASAEDRGVGVIKEKVKQFASTKSLSAKMNIVFFDEANGLTYDAQEALKNTIERFHENCRFIFATNEFDRITPPIVSRCQVFEFGLLPQEKMADNVMDILEKEKIKFKEQEVDNIVELFYPDFRTIINTVQLHSSNSKLNYNQATKVYGNKTELRDLILKGQIFKARQMLAGVPDYLWVYRYLFNEFIPKEVGVEAQSEAAVMVAEYLHRNSTIIDKEINIAACIVELMGIVGTEIDFG